MFLVQHFAKHRLCILIQHHPFVIAADTYGEAWPPFEQSLQIGGLHGSVRSQRRSIIDQKWFNGQRKKDTAGANSVRQAFIVLPPLMGEFLSATMTYFRHGRRNACTAEIPGKRQQLRESQHYATR